MAQIINFNKYLGQRPKRSKKPEELENFCGIAIKFLDDEKTGVHYQVTGEYDKTLMGRAILAEALVAIAEDMLSDDDPAIIYEIIETFRKSLTEQGE